MCAVSMRTWSAGVREDDAHGDVRAVHRHIEQSARAGVGGREETDICVDFPSVHALAKLCGR